MSAHSIFFWRKLTWQGAIAKDPVGFYLFVCILKMHSASFLSARCLVMLMWLSRPNQERTTIRRCKQSRNVFESAFFLFLPSLSLVSFEYLVALWKIKALHELFIFASSSRGWSGKQNYKVSITCKHLKETATRDFMLGWIWAEHTEVVYEERQHQRILC